MNEAMQELLSRYSLNTRDQYINALKEIIQEIALLGLWRAKFFEHSAFYGGTALRILYGLNRFSEDLDFTLLKPQPDFKLEKYLPSIVTELESFGFSVTLNPREKTFESSIESAFLKANTREHLLRIGAHEKIARGNKEELLVVKIKVDTDPPSGFTTASKYLTRPIAFSVKTLIPEDLFAGKIHALLYRQWNNRIVKGRDWFDFVWYISREIPVNLSILTQMMHQAGNLTESYLTHEKLNYLLEQKIQHLNIEAARNDVAKFLKSPDETAVWSQDFFLSLLPHLKVIS